MAAPVGLVLLLTPVNVPKLVLISRWRESASDYPER